MFLILFCFRIEFDFDFSFGFMQVWGYRQIWANVNLLRSLLPYSNPKTSFPGKYFLGSWIFVNLEVGKAASLELA